MQSIAVCFDSAKFAEQVCQAGNKKLLLLLLQQLLGKSLQPKKRRAK